mgnify:CR=1 FL=1
MKTNIYEEANRCLLCEQLPKFLSPDHLDRETIVFPKIDREQCIGCDRCYVSCMDGGHQAITFDTKGSLPSGEVGRGLRQPRIVGTKCVGCHLCRLVCPTGAIGMTKRIYKK